MKQNYVANDVPLWILEQFNRIDFNKVSGKELEVQTSNIHRFCKLSMLPFKKTPIETKWIDQAIPQGLLDTISQIDFNKIDFNKQQSIENQLAQYISTNFKGKLK